MNSIYLFDCPVHGLEHILCFRAFDIQYLFLWKKFNLVEIPMVEDDYKILQKFAEEKI